MTRQITTFIAILLVPMLARAVPEIQNLAAGDVRTTGCALCWETTEPAQPGVRVFTDAGGTQEVTDHVLIEHQSLTTDRREVSSTPASRDANRQLQAAMESRRIVLTRLSGLDPGTTYWVRAQALDGSGSVQDESSLIEVTTAARATFIVESRQLIVDLTGAAVVLGDMSGVIVRLATPASPYPLFAVASDGSGSSRARFDLNHFLDATGEANLVTTSGMTLDLVISFIGAAQPDGVFEGSEVAYTGDATAARSSVATFTTTTTDITLAALAESATALLGVPVTLRLEATNGAGTPLANFDRPLVLSAPALVGGPVTSAPLTDGILARQDIILDSLGPQTVTVTDPVSGNSTSIDLEVISYTYDNFRTHYFGSPTNPDGDLSANLDSDLYPNLMEFAYGLNPRVANGPLETTGTTNLTKRGGPVTILRIDSTQGSDFRVTFLRHRKHAEMGLSYNPQLSSDLTSWFDSSYAPTVLAQDGDMELVSVRYPYFTPLARKAQFFRLSVTLE